MDEATLARAFEPFFTTKEIGSGSGLGLPMVQGFAAQSGGAVQIRSKAGSRNHGRALAAAGGRAAIRNRRVEAVSFRRDARPPPIRRLRINSDPGRSLAGVKSAMSQTMTRYRCGSSSGRSAHRRLATPRRLARSPAKIWAYAASKRRSGVHCSRGRRQANNDPSPGGGPSETDCGSGVGSNGEVRRERSSSGRGASSPRCCRTKSHAIARADRSKPSRRAVRCADF